MTILIAPQIWRRAPVAVTAGRQLGNRLNPTERTNVRAAVLYLCGRHGSRAAQIAALGMSRDSIAKARSRSRPQTYRLACMVARAANQPVEKAGSAVFFGWRSDVRPRRAGLYIRVRFRVLTHPEGFDSHAIRLIQCRAAPRSSRRRPDCAGRFRATPCAAPMTQAR